MAKIWVFVTLGSCVIAALTGRTGAAAEQILACGDDAVSLMLTLLGTMTLWSGLMEILSDTGDVQRIGRGFRSLAAPLFSELRDEGCWSAMCMNLSANLLGLGNAATPAGIDAAKRLAGQGETGLRALAMLLVIDNASLQLLPTTVISMRQAAGSTDAAGIWLPTLATSAAAMVTGVLMMGLIQKGGGMFERHIRRGAVGLGGADSAPGRDDGV